jgi:hypothetical protein
MDDAARMASFPVTIAVGMLLGWRRPELLRRVARAFAAVTGIALGCIIATGWGHDQELASSIHRWLSHSLFILTWNTVPFTVGVALARSRGRPVATVRDILVPVAVLGIIFLASVTGYLGPSHRPIGPMTLNRFRVFHYGVFPSLAVGLSALWYAGFGPHRPDSIRGVPGPPTDA